MDKSNTHKQEAAEARSGRSRERSMAQEITEDGVHKDWDNNRKSNSRIPLNKREYAKGRIYEVAHLKCIRAIQYQDTFRRFLFKYNRWIYIS